MADVWVVMAHIGAGEIVGAYSTLSLAQAAVGAKPAVSYDLVLCTVDADVGFTVQQQGGPVLTAAPPGGQTTGVPRHASIRNGRTR